MAIISILQQDLETKKAQPQVYVSHTEAWEGREDTWTGYWLEGRTCLTRECCEAFLKTARKQQHTSFFRICCGTGNSLPFIFLYSILVDS